MQCASGNLDSLNKRYGARPGRQQARRGTWALRDVASCFAAPQCDVGSWWLGR